MSSSLDSAEEEVIIPRPEINKRRNTTTVDVRDLQKLLYVKHDTMRQRKKNHMVELSEKQRGYKLDRKYEMLQ